MDRTTIDRPVLPPVTSYSVLTRHRTCPQAWNYEQLRQLEPAQRDEDAIERTFGSWWHMIRGLDSIQRGVAAGTIRYVPKRLKGAEKFTLETRVQHPPTVRDGLELVQRWWKTLSGETKELWLDRLGETPVRRLVYLHQNWRDRWAEETKAEEVLAVELFWQRQLPAAIGPNGEEVAPQAIRGFIDEVYRDTARNLVVCRDHKTAGNIMNRTAVDDLMDSQLQLYAWGASPTIAEWGRMPNAVAYDRVRTTKPKEPQLTRSGTLSKSVTDYDLRTYAEWSRDGVPYPGLKKDGSGAGTYETDPKVVENLSTPVALAKWLDRALTPISRQTMNAHVIAASWSSIDSAETVRRMGDGDQAPRNFAGHCRFCDFKELCAFELVGGSSEEVELSEFRLQRRPPKTNRTTNKEEEKK